MSAGALTYVLILIYYGSNIATISGYDSPASCEAAGREAMKVSGMRATHCIPGPVEAKR